MILLMGTSSVSTSNLLKLPISPSFYFLFNMAKWVSVIPSDSSLSFSLHGIRVFISTVCTDHSQIWGVLRRHACVPWDWTCLGWIQNPAYPTGVSIGVCFQPGLLMPNWKAFLSNVFPSVTPAVHPHVSLPWPRVYQPLLFKLCVLIPSAFHFLFINPGL